MTEDLNSRRPIQQVVGAGLQPGTARLRVSPFAEMKPLQQYFHMVLFIQYVLLLTFESVDEILWCYHSNETSLTVLSPGNIYLKCKKLLSLWIKSYGTTIQMKPLQQYFDMVPFNKYVVLTFQSVDEILQRYLFRKYVFIIFESVDHSSETSLAVLTSSWYYLFI